MNAARPSDDLRKSLLAKVHIAKKQIDLDDDAYRDIIERLFNCRSASALSSQQLVQLVEELKRKGFRDQARAKPAAAKAQSVPRETKNAPNAGVIAKLRALWLSLYHLAIVDDPSDAALAAFVKRQTKTSNAGDGVAKLQWLPAGDAFRAIEALKDWAAREGVNWDAYEDPRDCVLAAQAKKCMALGLFGSIAEISTYQSRSIDPTRRIQIIGEKIRQRLRVLGS